jgi:Ca2+-binding EF-hand superfamily protein
MPLDSESERMLLFNRYYREGTLEKAYQVFCKDKEGIARRVGVETLVSVISELRSAGMKEEAQDIIESVQRYSPDAEKRDLAKFSNLVADIMVGDRKRKPDNG